MQGRSEKSGSEGPTLWPRGAPGAEGGLFAERAPQPDHSAMEEGVARDDQPFSPPVLLSAAALNKRVVTNTSAASPSLLGKKVGPTRKRLDR